MTHDPVNRMVGVVMLNTTFPRLVGDIGNPQSFSLPVRYRRVAAADIAAVVGTPGLDPKAAAGIVAAAQALVAEGAGVIATSCGFLGALQATLERAVPVPVISSALMLIPWLRAVYGARAPLGVLTFDARALAPVHFGGHFDAHIHIAGIEQGAELHRVIAADLPRLDRDRAQADVLAAAARLMDGPTPPRAIVLECTNLAPYAPALRAATGRPVYDLVGAIHWLMNA